jgi:hypothetical protein
VYEIEELEEGRFLEVDLPVAPQDVQGARDALPPLFEHASAVVHLFVVAQEHQIEQTLPRHPKLRVCSRLHLAPATDCEHPVRKFEEELMGVVGDNGHLASVAPVSQDSGEEGEIVEDVLLVEQEIVHVDVESSGKLDPRLVPFVEFEAFLVQLRPLLPQAAR